MSVFRVTDMSNQIFLDNFQIFRVKIENDENLNFQKIQEFRSFSCSASDKSDREQEGYCFPFGKEVAMDEAKRRKFLDLDQIESKKEVFNNGIEHTEEWNGYYLQKSEEYFKNSAIGYL